MVRSHEPCSLQVQQDQLNTTMYNSLQWAALIYSRKDFFFSLLFFLCKACLSLGIFCIFSRESCSSMMQDQEINISVYSWAKYCKLCIKFYQLSF